MSAIVTFYSFKGGVGRTMAVANIAALLVQRRVRVLAVDFDLEAPGLERYFLGHMIRRAEGGAGMLELLTAAAAGDTPPDWRKYLSHVDLPGGTLALLTAGCDDAEYFDKVLKFDWRTFFAEKDGGDFIESLREEWRREFDIILIDSRTGITDAGGVCTIQLPDILVPVFTCNEQSLGGAINVAMRAESARQNLSYDRMPLLVFPLPSRFDSRTEFEEAQKWLSIFAQRLEPFYRDWLPADAKSPQFLDRAKQVLERTKTPYVAYFSFGEKLPVLTHATSDPESLGYAYATVASLIEKEFHEVEALFAYTPTPQPTAVDPATLSLRIERARAGSGNANVRRELAWWSSILQLLVAKGDEGEFLGHIVSAVTLLEGPSPQLPLAASVRKSVEFRLRPRRGFLRRTLDVFGRAATLGADYLVEIGALMGPACFCLAILAVSDQLDHTSLWFAMSLGLGALLGVLRNIVAGPAAGSSRHFEFSRRRQQSPLRMFLSRFAITGLTASALPPFIRFWLPTLYWQPTLGKVLGQPIGANWEVSAALLGFTAGLAAMEMFERISSLGFGHERLKRD